MLRIPIATFYEPNTIYDINRFSYTINSQLNMYSHSSSVVDDVTAHVSPMVSVWHVAPSSVNCL